MIANPPDPLELFEDDPAIPQPPNNAAPERSATTGTHRGIFILTLPPEIAPLSIRGYQNVYCEYTTTQYGSDVLVTKWALELLETGERLTCLD